MQEIKVKKDKYNDDFSICIHETFTPDQRARFAMDMLGKWGMVAGKDDGEDSAGRSKLIPMEEEELVYRAIKTTEILFETIKTKGWFTKNPSIKEIESEINTET